DLFGELSDEEDEPTNRDEEKRPRSDDNAEITMKDIFGDEDEDDEGEQDRERERPEQEAEGQNEEEEEGPVPETRIEVEIPRIVVELGKGIHFVKWPNFLSIDTHPYDPQLYE